VEGNADRGVDVCVSVCEAEEREMDVCMYVCI